MPDEDLLQALAAQERGILQARPQEWDELAHGRITPDEAEARARARTAASPASALAEDDVVRARELFSPPSAALDEAIVDRLVAMAQANATARVAAEAQPSAANDAPRAGTNGDNVVHREPSWWQRKSSIVGAAVMAAAAAVLVFSWPRTAIDDGPARVELPRHELTIEGASQIRGDATDVQKAAPGTTITLRLQPARGYDVQPSFAACLQKDGENRALAATPSFGRPGQTFEVRAQLPADLATGRWELVALVAGGALPSDVAASCATPPSDVQVVRGAIDIVR